MNENIQAKVDKWLNGNFDLATKEEIKKMQQENPDLLIDAFYQDLSFGTGGLRGIMGVGTNRINKYTIGICTQGFANYLKKSFPNEEIKVAIAHDSRNDSRFFAETTANVFAANGIKVYLFDSLRPTPELSFAIRYLNCNAGVNCTASHNPKEYNGYKAYWKDGGQLVPPHDKAVIAEVGKILSIDEVKWEGGKENITIIGSDIDAAYIKMVKGLSVQPDIIEKQKDLGIIYTPIHGTGIKLVPQVLKAYGFSNLSIVEEQSNPDGNFPTVIYPNPEESEAMDLGLKMAKESGADILCGTDPDADRVGIAVKDNEGNWILMNGNQTALLAFSYMMEARKKMGIAQSNDMVVKTIVTTDAINKVAKSMGVKCYDVLTGFKWIAELIKEKEGKENYVIGGEESFGLMVGDKVRDKDAVSAVAILCEMAAVEKNNGRTLFDKLVELYIAYGFYHESLVSITKKGMKGQEEIAEMMQQYRANPPKEINGIKVKELLDYEVGTGKNLDTNESWKINLPKSNVLQFILEDGTKISARPSGTEPKIKFYFSVNTRLDAKENYNKTLDELKNRIAAIIKAMKLK